MYKYVGLFFAVSTQELLADISLLLLFMITIMYLILIYYFS